MLAPERASKAGLLCVQVTLAMRGRQKSIGSIGHLAMAAFGLVYARERPKWPARLLLLLFSCLFFLFLCPHVGVFWPNQISPITTFCGLFFLYLFLLNKYLLILSINKSLIIFPE
jgi:hypothetical protein